MADFDRFRSFAERYIIARADKFRLGFEREDAWEALLAAKSIYSGVAMVAKTDTTDTPQAEVGQQATNMAVPNPLVGPYLPPAKMQQFMALRQSRAGPPAAQGAPSQWGQMISDAFKKFSAGGMKPPNSLVKAAEDHIANGGKIP